MPRREAQLVNDVDLVKGCVDVVGLRRLSGPLPPPLGPGWALWSHSKQSSSPGKGRSFSQSPLSEPHRPPGVLPPSPTLSPLPLFPSLHPHTTPAPDCTCSLVLCVRVCFWSSHCWECLLSNHAGISWIHGRETLAVVTLTPPHC